MEITAKAKFIRTAPRKTRLVIDLVRGMKVGNALDQLKFANKKVAKDVSKLIESGIANAEHNYELSKDNLFVKEIKVDEGPTLKRWMPRAHGRATSIRKRTSHIILKLAEIEDSGEKKAKKQEVEAPVKLDATPKDDVDKKKADTKKSKTLKNKEGNEDEAKEVHDPRGEGKGKNTKSEGSSSKGFAGKIFRRKSG